MKYHTLRETVEGMDPRLKGRILTITPDGIVLTQLHPGEWQTVDEDFSVRIALAPPEVLTLAAPTPQMPYPPAKT